MSKYCMYGVHTKNKPYGLFQGASAPHTVVTNKAIEDKQYKGNIKVIKSYSLPTMDRWGKTFVLIFSIHFWKIFIGVNYLNI